MSSRGLFTFTAESKCECEELVIQHGHRVTESAEVTSVIYYKKS